MSYPSYLIHYNKLHSKKNGQFISGDGDSDGVADEHHRYSKNGVKVNKKLYKQVEKSRSYEEATERLSTNKNIINVSKNKNIREAFAKLKTTKPNSSLEEPNWMDDKATVEAATKQFKKDWPSWTKSPTDHKMFGYYLEEASTHSTSFAKKVAEYNKAVKNDSWNKAYNNYEKELEKAAKEFAGNYADKPVQGNKYVEYSYIVKRAIAKAVENENHAILAPRDEYEYYPDNK